MSHNDKNTTTDRNNTESISRRGKLFSRLAQKRRDDLDSRSNAERAFAQSGFRNTTFMR